MISQKRFPSNFLSPGVGNFLIACCLVATGIVGLLFILAPAHLVRLQPAMIVPESGYNFSASFPHKACFPFHVLSDSSAGPEDSAITVLEDGRALGPAHSQHSDIRQIGLGRFSFWKGQLYFSTSDNSDPRTNKRTYSVRYETAPVPWLVFSVVLFDLCVFVLCFRQCGQLIRRYAIYIAALTVSILALRLLASAKGLKPPLFALTASPLDYDLIRSLSEHLLLGLLLALFFFTSGLGVVIGFGRGRTVSLNALLLSAPLPGLLTMLLSAFVTVTLPFGPAAAVIIWAIAASPLLTYRMSRQDWSFICNVLLGTIPAAALCAIVMGFRFHGPTATLSGAPLGDTEIYVGYANALAFDLFSHFFLGVEGARLSLGNLSPALLAAAFLRYHWFDPYLFFSTSFIVMALVSSGLLFAALCRSALEREKSYLRLIDVMIIGGLIFGMFRAPNDLIASPPFIFFLLITFSVIHFWSMSDGADGSNDIKYASMSIGTAIVGSALSKVVSVGVLAPLAVSTFTRRLLKKASFIQLALTTSGIALFFAYGTFMLKTYGHSFIEIGKWGPLSFVAFASLSSSSSWPFICAVTRDIGGILVGVAAIRSRHIGLILGIWFGLISYFCMSFLFYTAFSAAVLTVALAIVVKSENFVGSRLFLGLAGILLIPWNVLSEVGGSSVIAAWFSTVAAVVYVGWLSTRDGRFGHFGVKTGYAATAGLLSLVCGLTLWSAATGNLYGGQDTFVFTPDMRDIWLAVKDRTPTTALIFTDQTGPTESRTGGWDDFALAAQRQFYVVSWQNSALRYDSSLRSAQLKHNEAVLDGKEKPGDLRLSRNYSKFYAVIKRTRKPPLGATLTYANRSYCLFELAGK